MDTHYAHCYIDSRFLIISSLLLLLPLIFHIIHFLLFDSRKHLCLNLSGIAGSVILATGMAWEALATMTAMIAHTTMKEHPHPIPEAVGGEGEGASMEGGGGKERV